ncbi:tryptophan-rich sensory protein [Mycobacterium shinjukuense]|uniref:Uncharacterized protein n=1 Tax=Mycobacterium shinjukuense TaxID=398694 RepID=A0A7I7MQT5_9MYCO|nr:tryptophan-rich sensory protein [Mycobacterium shinjukuense]ORB70229.1 hypothetical protein BST45_06845 [Mycobacterium shinjukuense]BBX74152.1 hypothetical protein MSHI_20580 [Mycobacterium shinjukuense]
MAWVTAIAVAVPCGLVEAWLSGPTPFRILTSLAQPKWALPRWGWMLVGGVCYLIMAYAAATALRLGAPGKPGITFVVAVLLTDGIWNYLLYRRRRIDLAYAYLSPYPTLVVVTTWAIVALDSLVGTLVALYLAFLPYERAIKVEPRTAAAAAVCGCFGRGGGRAHGRRERALRVGWLSPGSRATPESGWGGAISTSSWIRSGGCVRG